MHLLSRFAPLAAIGSLFFSTLAAGQSEVSYAEELSKKIEAAGAVAPLGSSLFGDETNWYNGQTTFRVVDVSIPGNNSLPVQIARTLSASPWEGLPSDTGLPRLMGDWELELPYVSSMTAQGSGWQPSNRCSTVVGQPDVIVSGVAFPTDEYWRGYSISIPGHASGSLLKRDPAYTLAPTGGASYPWVASGHTQVKCTDTGGNTVMLQNGTGQGFFAVTADGTRYRFDWQVTRPFATLRKVVNEVQGGTATLNRDEVRIYATRAEDRFGNWVEYTYSGDRLTGIQSSDGREITIGYTGNEISTVTAVGAAPAGNRTWTYGYAGSRLSSVLLPDGTSWIMDETPGLQIIYTGNPPATNPCNLPPTEALSGTQSGPKVWKFTHPNGAHAEFTFTVVRHARTAVPMNKRCQYIPAEGELNPGNSLEFDTYALTSKKVWHANLTPTLTTWTAAYGSGTGGTKAVTLTNPDGTKARYTFGTKFYIDEGKLLLTEVLNSSGSTMHSTQATLLTLVTDPGTGNLVCPGGINYACRIGSTMQDVEDAFGSVIVVPTLSSVISQDGSTFETETTQGNFDVYARPIVVEKTSASFPQGFTKTETIEYHDETAEWVLGQVKKLTVSGPGVTAVEQSRTDYYAATALPWKQYSFGKLTQTLSYNTDGTVLSVADGIGNTTTLSNWKRGLPQTITFPWTSECAGQCTQTAVVDDAGWIRSVTNENGDTTSYEYDGAGRISLIQYPSPDTVAWASTVISYGVAPTGELGVVAGTWRRQEVTGNFRKRTYYDARLRPILEEQYDTLTEQAIYARKSFDYDNRETFASYPSNLSSASSGINTFYDALGRATQRQTTGGTTLETIAYPTGTQKRVTDANGHQTTFSFQAFGGPSYENAIKIAAPEGQTTDIVRDIFGAMTEATQSGTYAGGIVSVTRNYLYNANHLLCMRIEPETGQKVIQYDAAGNIAWTADGQSLDPVNCNNIESVLPADRTTFEYDARNRVRTVNAPGADSDVTTTYHKTGDPSTIANPGSTWVYTFNARRLLEHEALTADGLTFNLTYRYNPQGVVDQIRYPSGREVPLSPDAFGRTTSVGSYATNISYHANGAVSAFSYGNLLSYSMSLDARQRPQSLTVAGGGENRVNLLHTYDAASNVISIIDTGDVTRGMDSRQMIYDGLHRLTKVSIEGIFEQDFTTVGAQSTSIPQGVTNVTMTLHGGGGGGGKHNNGGGGGGGSALCQKSVPIEQEEWGGVVNFTVGSGGNGGSAPTAGAATTLTRTFQAGSVSLSAGGGAAASTSTGGAGGVGGAGCATKITGQAGTSGGALAGGKGGDSPQGGVGGAGATGDGQTGAVGGVPGGGGGGGGPRDLETSTLAGNGGAGAKGRVRFEWNVGTVTYSYDPLNNLRTRGGANPLSYEGYGTGSNRLMQVTGGLTRTYAYNAEGQVTSDGTGKTFTWNGADRIVEVSGTAPASYRYDALGKRFKTIKGGAIEYTLYSRAGTLLYSYKPALSESTDYVYLGSLPLAELRMAPGLLANPRSQDSPESSPVTLEPGKPPQVGGLIAAQTETTYLHANLLGSPIQWSERSLNGAPGEWLGSEHYEAYGHKLNGVAD